MNVRRTKREQIGKRIFDIISATLVLVLFSWLILIVGVIVKLTSRGPVFFKDKRVGRDGRDIYIYKFRTMYTDAEQKIQDYLTAEEYETWLVERKIDEDPRITKVGRTLRRTSLDELPQLFNIIRGDISVVGPRPITRWELETNYSKQEQERLLSCKPGLTGYWAVCGRSKVPYANGERQKMELDYIERRSVLFDFKIILMSLKVVLYRIGAK